jgi:phenylacetate-coenzyme A ligase PaaK-like adenylate-forming protein
MTVTHPTAQAVDVDELVREMMQWHFGAATGSPFWLELATKLPFDPLRDVRGWGDLALFPDVTAQWRDVPVRELIPRGLLGGPGQLRVFESGGTTGRPKRIVESTHALEIIPWVSAMLDAHGVPDAGDWLYIGPTGPHIVGRSLDVLARHRGSLCFYVDLDPRWVKRCVRDGDTATAARYIDHVVDQARDVLRNQDIRVLFTTPPVLEAICGRPGVLDLVSAKARAVIWAGTSISAETLRLLEEEIFVDAKLIGLYGNTMMGIAPQRPREPEDEQLCVFQPHHPFCRIELVDPGDPDRIVEYGERGQVRTTLLAKDFFVPNLLERDTAIRVRPTARYPWDGVADVAPLVVPGGSSVVEGVY